MAEGSQLLDAARQQQRQLAQMIASFEVRQGGLPADWGAAHMQQGRWHVP